MDGGWRLTHRSIPAVGASIFALTLQCLGVRWLKILATRRLDIDQPVVATWSTIAKATISRKWSFSVIHCCHVVGGRYICL